MIGQISLTPQNNLILKHLQNRLRSYSLAATAVMAIPAISEAGIVHEPLEPDVSLFYDGALYFMDVNDDAIPDFMFGAATSYASTYVPTSGFFSERATGYFQMSAFLSNYMMVSGSVVAGLISSTGAAIASSANWQSGSALLGQGSFDRYGDPSWGTMTIGPYYAGNFPNATYYAGLQFESVAGTHYGWVQIQVNFIFGFGPPTMEAIIMDYAYEECVNTAISPGQTSSSCIPTGIEEKNNNATVYSFGRDIRINNGDGVVSIYNGSGKQVLGAQLAGGSEIFSVDGNAGIYMVQITNDKGSSTHKVHLN